MAMRNPIVHLVMNQIQTVGDCHLGRVFKTNVSLDRRGEYEKTQMAAFRELLFTPRPEEIPPARFIRTQVGIYSIKLWFPTKYCSKPLKYFKSMKRSV